MGRYKDGCGSKKTEMLPSIVRYLKEASKKKEELDVVIRGNDKYNFHDRVTDEQLELLVDTLKPRPLTVLSVDLRFNHISDKGAIALATFLKEAKNIGAVNLHGNSIGSQGAEQLAQALKGAEKLTYLNLNGNSIGTDGCIAITELIFYNPKLRHLDVGNNDIKYDGIIALANVVGSNYTIEVLNMENPSFLFFMVGQEWATHIGKMLANNLGLQKLSLRKHKLRCDGVYTIMEHLLENNKLKVLDLSANEIGVEGCAAIAKYLRQEGCVLEGLQLANNKAGDLGAKNLAQALAVNKSLCYLDFTYNNAHDDGLSRLAESLDINVSVRILKLYGHNYFGQEAMALFFKLQKKKPTAWIDFTVYVVDDHYDLGYLEHDVPPAWIVNP
jgi:Ran GTPase-activating protein (RanGAP) involved in mRNA processing and transport